MQIPEILAPAGSFDALVAAVENGADAVYLGGKLFSARAYATNFDDEEMAKAIEYAHLRNVRIYVTANTLIDNSEIKEAITYIKKLYDLGVDAIIVQDLGLTYLIRKILPDMHVHGSTQMTVHNAEGAQVLEEFGLNRVVLAREVSLADMSAIKHQSDIELEVFAHGALCVSYSGQCLMSSLIGGRSGNRGRCAQPCRMTYTLVDEKGNNLSDEKIGAHLLSPRDLNTLEVLPEIIKTGIESLKFEGRMKRPEYVATVIRIYREAVESLKDNPNLIEDVQERQRQLAQIFNRDFTTGYFLNNPGSDLMSFKRPNNRGVRLGRIEKILGKDQLASIKLNDSLSIGDGVEIWLTKGGRQGFYVSEIYLNDELVDEAKPGDLVTINIQGKPKPGDRVFKTHDNKLIEKAQQTYKEPQKLIVLNLKLTAHEGKEIILEGWDEEGNTSNATSTYIVEKAKKHASTKETVLKQLNRLGGTAFQLGQVILEIDEDIMLPASELNQLRRNIADDITKLRLEKYQYSAVGDKDFMKKLTRIIDIPETKTSRRIKIAVRVADYNGAKAAIEGGADIIYLGGEVFSGVKSFNDNDFLKSVELGNKYQSELVYALPRIFHEREKESVYKMVQQAQSCGLDALLIGNIGGIKVAQNAGWDRELYGDFGFNVFNNLSLEVLSQLNISRATLSPELTFKQIEKIRGKDMEVECIVHGPLPMMICEYCAVGSIFGGKNTDTLCTRPCKAKFFGLKDRMNFIFPIEVDQFCRMHIFNPKELCLIEDMDSFINAGINVIRIEGRRYKPEEVFDITNSYRKIKEAIINGTWKQINVQDLQTKLSKYTKSGFTKGHYFRGVL